MYDYLILPKAFIESDLFRSVGSQLPLLILLMTHSDTQLKPVSCGYQGLADRLEVSYLTILRGMKTLEKEGVISIRRRPNKSNIISFNNSLADHFRSRDFESIKLDVSMDTGSIKVDKSEKGGSINFDTRTTYSSYKTYINTQQQPSSIEVDPYPSLADLPLSHEQRLQLSQDFTEHQVNQAVNVYHEYLRSSVVRSPYGFMKRSLEENWKDEKTVQAELDKQKEVDALIRESKIRSNREFLESISSELYFVDGVCVYLELDGRTPMIRADLPHDEFTQKVKKHLGLGEADS